MTSKQAHDKRDTSGRYTASNLCDACSKPAGTEPLCDDEVCADGNQRPGFILCERKRCLAKHRAMPLDERRVYFAATVAARA